MSGVNEIAEELNKLSDSIILIYALNSSGKTRLSVAYKDFTKASNEGKHSGVYYNAYSEDLFVWDNDEENDNENLKLTVLPSSLSQFHSFLIEDDEMVREKLEPYFPKYDFKLNQHQNPEDGIESITFFVDEKSQSPIKISRGEERIFVWCFFLALFEVDGWADQQNAHILIDDPVSSLDEHNIFITTRSILELIKANYLKKEKIIVFTHHIGLFSILATWLKSDDSKGGVGRLTKTVILKNKDGELSFKGTNSDVFLYHLHLLQTLQEAKNEQLYKYHMVLLRQVLENINSFIGSRKIGRILTDIGVEEVDQKADEINSLSHQQAFKYQFSEMSQVEEELFIDVFDKLMAKYNFKI
ncbi:AAA family ATPase [Fulvivirgaceae bacterium BMA10]|uniref:AAA family ATPase n=1 Tax=Splendidivirga corallicola TaxID=3051826 RepID=A0ABT8KNT5_9BACT|nr:AAA family ATPase [Fulvivirgaceae bacterium BMA10]